MQGIQDGACTASSPLDLEDIEDLIENSDSIFYDQKPRERTKKTNVVIPKIRKRERVSKPANETSEDDPKIEKCENEEDFNFLPGKATVYVKTWGCAYNSVAENILLVN